LHTSTDRRELHAAKDGANLEGPKLSRNAAIFAAGFAIGLVVLHVTVTRPMTREFARLQHQVGNLQRGVQKLTGQTEQAAKTSELLGLLAEQGRKARAATDALAQIESLHSQLIKGQDATAEARSALSSLSQLRRDALDAKSDSGDVALALEQLQSLEDRLIGQYHSTVNAHWTLDELTRLREQVESEGARLAAARQALEGLIEIESRALAEGDRAEQAAASVVQWERLNDRLIEASEQTAEARDVGEELVAIKETILCGDDAMHRQDAREALNELIKIRERLDGQSHNVAAAQVGLDGLLTLKDRILARTGDLADAVETLELTGDLNRQLQDAIRRFDNVRRWLVEIVTLEPTIERAVGALKPLEELANLRHLSPVELRRAARAISDDRAARFAKKPAAAASERAAPGSDSADDADADTDASAAANSNAEAIPYPCESARHGCEAPAPSFENVNEDAGAEVSLDEIYND
jgi:hypothetical protein